MLPLLSNKSSWILQLATTSYIRATKKQWKKKYFIHKADPEEKLLSPHNLLQQKCHITAWCFYILFHANFPALTQHTASSHTTLKHQLLLHFWPESLSTHHLLFECSKDVVITQGKVVWTQWLWQAVKVQVCAGLNCCMNIYTQAVSCFYMWLWVQWQTCITTLKLHSPMNSDRFHTFTTQEMDRRMLSHLYIHVSGGVAILTLPSCRSLVSYYHLHTFLTSLAAKLSAHMMMGHCLKVFVWVTLILPIL